MGTRDNEEYETDEEIIQSYKDGNERAFKELIQKYTAPLYNFVARLTDRGNAEDIVQETFIKVWKNLKKFDASRASFKTWLFTIARNTSTDFLRRKKSLSFSDIGEPNGDDISSFAENITDETLLPDEILQKLQDQDVLNEALGKISIRSREVLTLHYQEEMTFDEIGKVLDKPLNTVKSQHRRALIELRKML